MFFKSFISKVISKIKNNPLSRRLNRYDVERIKALSLQKDLNATTILLKEEKAENERLRRDILETEEYIRYIKFCQAIYNGEISYSNIVLFEQFTQDRVVQ